MMEPNHRSSKEKQSLTLKMHELSQCSDTNFVTTQTQEYMTGTKGMGRLKVIDSQSKPKNQNNIKYISYQQHSQKYLKHNSTSVNKSQFQTQVMHNNTNHY